MTDSDRHLTDYQARVATGAISAVRRGGDVLIEAPTGAGKTATFARIAMELAGSGEKVLILTHRKTLLQQMAGDPDAHDEKSRQGEISWWGMGQKTGRIADRDLGGIDQSADVVIGMVETVANHLGKLEPYSVILVDEGHHVSEISALAEEMGAYSQVLAFYDRAPVVACSATLFRGDGGKLHPRLEAAHREVVGIEEARAAGRIVPIRTIIGRAPLKTGKIPADLARDQIEGRLKSERSASAIIERERGEAYFDWVAEDWSRLARERKTIAFVDRVKDIGILQARFDAIYGKGVAVGVHGDQSAEQNRDAISRYRTGEASVLIACQMIGEGFDVPSTDVVMSLNASLSRAEMNQFGGRATRAAPGKSEGIFIDYGTSSILHGRLEEQHEIQNVNALAAMGSAIAAAQVIGRMAPVILGDWQAVAGQERSFLMQRVEAGYHVLEIRHGSERERGRRSGRHGPESMPRRFEHPTHGCAALSVQDMATVLSSHATREAAFLARSGGFASDRYANLCADLLREKKGIMDLLGVKNDPDRRRNAGHRARVRALLGTATGDIQRAMGSKLVRRALEGATSGREAVTEGLHLSVEIFGICAGDGRIPMGLRAEAREARETLRRENIDAMSPARLQREAIAATHIFEGICRSGAEPALTGVVSDIADPMKKGLRQLQLEVTPKDKSR